MAEQHLRGCPAVWLILTREPVVKKMLTKTDKVFLSDAQVPSGGHLCETKTTACPDAISAQVAQVAARK